MGRNAQGQVVVSSLKITPTLNDKALRSSVPGSREWAAAMREATMPVIPGSGITSRLLRQVQLGAPARAGQKAIATDRWPTEGDRKRPRRGAPETIKITWWRRLNNRYCELRREGRPDFAKVLAEEFGLSRGAMRNRISRGIVKGQITGEYMPPPSATRVQRKPK